MLKKNETQTKRNAALLRLEQIKIENYKGIDSLEINFTPPQFSDTPDVTVIGSSNGLGKTSILECCSLLLLVLDNAEREIDGFRPHQWRRFFSKNFAVSGRLKKDDSVVHISLAYDERKDCFNIKKNSTRKISGNAANKEPVELVFEQNIETILGHDPNPTITDAFLFFNGYRKISEGSIELGKLVTEQNRSFIQHLQARGETIISSFKVEILRSLMLGNPIFDKTDKSESEEVLKKLNSLLIKYAGAAIKKLDTSTNSKIDILLEHQESKEVFSFDGLSSGQKEIVSTFFLIWYGTRKKPKIVLIDEPEQHLNRDWQQTLVRDLARIAPNNQYILATHSAEVAAGVEQYQRIKLQKE